MKRLIFIIQLIEYLYVFLYEVLNKKRKFIQILRLARETILLDRG
jgi:hypothetical protein